MDRKTFDKKRETFRKGLETSKSLAVALSLAAVRHFAEHGDTSYIADFYSDITTAGKNYVRKAAFLKWLVAHAPVKMEQNKFLKDQDAAAKMEWDQPEKQEALLAKAATIPFYDFDPEAAITNFKAGDVISALNALVKKFENEKKMHAVDDAAKALVAKVKGLIPTLTAAAANNNTQSGEQAA